MIYHFMVTGGFDQFLIPSRSKSRFASNQKGPADLERSVYPRDPDMIEDPELLSFPFDVEDKILIRCSTANVPSHIPSEKDLIDSEMDEFLVEGLPIPGTMQYPEEAEYRDVVKVQPSVAPIPKREAQKKRKDNKKVAIAAKRALKQEEREKVAKVKRVELEKAGKEASLNKSLLAYIEMCTSTGQLNKALNSLNYYRMRTTQNPQFPSVTNISVFNLLLHAFASKVNSEKIRAAI